MLLSLIKRSQTLLASALLGGLLIVATSAQALIQQPSPVSMGGVKYPGGSRQIQFALTRDFDGGDVNISSTIEGENASDFHVTQHGPTLFASNSAGVYFTITFTPSNIGLRTAILNIEASGTLSSGTFFSWNYYVSLSGTAGDPEIVVKRNNTTIYNESTTPNLYDGTDFGTFTSGLSTRSFAIDNAGYADLTVSSISITGADAEDFYASFYPTFQAQQSNNFTIWFNPNSKTYNTRTATVTINSDAPSQPTYTFAIKATTAGVIGIEGGGIAITNGDTTPSLVDDTDFDVAMNTGEQVVSTYTIKNTGIGILSINSITVSGTHAADFTVGGITTPATITNGGSQTFTVTFNPSASGTRNATITVNNNAMSSTAYSFAVQGRGADPSDLDSYNPYANSEIHATAQQPDGKTLVGGDFTTMGGVTHNRLARINADGTVDSGFTTSVNGIVVSIVVQSDEKILIGGSFTTVNGTACNRIARLNSSGSLDTGFTPSTNGTVQSIALQPDGDIIIAGDFTNVNSTSKSRIARLNSDGTLDTGFTTTANDTVRSVLVQEDGKIIFSGLFTSVNSTSKSRIARLNSDGTLDTGFTASANNTPLALAIQPDGKIVMGGTFTSVNSTAKTRLARLNSNGTLDTGFTASANGHVYGLTLQADGKILVCGYLTQLNGTSLGYCGRLNSDSTLDTSFNAGANTYVFTSSLTQDGRVIIGGEFTTVQSTSRGRIARLDNNMATESLTVPSSSRIEWLRGGSSGEASRVTFDVSTDGGSTWTSLGAGVRISGGWELTGLSLSTGKIRARAHTPCGKLGASSSLLETIIDF